MALLWLLAGWVALSLIVEWDGKRMQRAREDAPCKHGIAGAGWAPRICVLCSADIDEQARLSAERRAEEERQQDARAAEHQRRRQEAYHNFVLQARTPAFLRTMDPRAFELLACDLFRRMGYAVEETPASGDHGIDGILRHGDVVTLMQCKRFQGSVGEPVLRDLFGCMHHHRAAEGILVTTGRVTEAGRAWIEGKKIRVIELNALTDLVRQLLDESAVVPDSFTFEAGPMPEDASVCPRCGEMLRMRRGRLGAFYGCTRYPACHYTRDARRGRRGRPRM